MVEKRENPDRILEKLKKESDSKKKGHLKIFFGYAAGVGKTYAMLEAAHAAKMKGIDVVVGYIEPHTRPETLKLINGLEVLPPKTIEYKEIKIKEFDLDGAIERKPDLILVDELAHTNSNNCRHLKRYQDINELLKLGINVYTTVNVQHIESLNDIVASITGITVRERIPDRVFDDANQVELVDIEPEELIERLKSGKVYKTKQARQAIVNFFTVENLIALREIALRRTADHVNHISERMKQFQGNEYLTDGSILVCLSSSPSNAKIIRTASRMSKAFKGEFTALFVETPDYENMDEENKNRLKRNIRLAQQLGAKIEIVYGDDIALQIAEYARLSNISKIILGRSSYKRKFLFGKGALTDKLIAYAPNLDIYIIPDDLSLNHYLKNNKKIKPELSAKDFAKSIGILVLVTIVGLIFYLLGFGESNIITIYIFGVLVTSVITESRLQSIISSLISVIVYNFLFTHPRFTLYSYGYVYPVTFIIMFISAVLTGSLASKIKRQAVQSTQMAYRTKVLLEMNQLLQQENDRDGIINVTSNQLRKLLRKNIIFYIANEGILSEPMIFPIDDLNNDMSKYISDNERAVAQWAYKNNKHAGATTNTLGNSKCLYLAIRASGNVHGVVGIAMEGEQLDSFDNNIMLSILGDCGIALENDFISRKREEAAQLAKNEQVRANFLRCISHDLRTPLTSIYGSASILLNDESMISKQNKEQLYLDIYEDSLWLINLVENLLAATRIEDTSMKLNLESQLMEEVISEALRHIKRKNINHTIEVTQEEDYILAKIDTRLIIQVIINIVDNAIKYTPENTPIHIHTKKKNDMVIVEISDNGNGISDKEKEKIFDMFYTLNNSIADSKRSLGLGLSLCKSIITAHGGEIGIKDNSPHGTTFYFTLKSEEVKLHE